LQPATQWGWNEVFNNRIVHLLETIIWQNATPSEKGKKAQHMSKKPQIYRPDWMPKTHNDSSIKKDTIAADVDTIKELLARPRF
jgi:hypothetical protein